MSRACCQEGSPRGKLGVPARQDSRRLPQSPQCALHEEGAQVRLIVSISCRSLIFCSTYLPIQERIYRAWFSRWMSDDSPPKPYWLLMRDLNMETSLSVFIGPYVTAEQRQEINDRYWLITKALELVNFPFAIPGTKIYNAVKARELVMKYLTAASAASKARMADPAEEAGCLIDQWTRAMIESRSGANADAENARLLGREYSDHEIAMVVLSFLMASQDAMASAIVYMFQLTADHPEVLAKVREEQYRVRGNDTEAPLTLELLDDMVYTRAVIKEVMRIMPPVIMVCSILSCFSCGLLGAGSLYDEQTFSPIRHLHRSKGCDGDPCLLEFST